MLLTVEDMVTRFGEEEMLQIAGRGPRDARTLQRELIEAAIAHASGVVLGYVRDRWPAAANGTPLLAAFAADIARWLLRGRGGQAAGMAEVVRQRYEDAIAALKDIAAGRLTLDLPADAPPADDAAAANELRVSSAMPPARAPGLLEGW